MSDIERSNVVAYAMF